MIQNARQTVRTSINKVLVHVVSRVFIYGRILVDEDESGEVTKEPSGSRTRAPPGYELSEKAPPAPPPTFHRTRYSLRFAASQMPSETANTF